MASIHFTIDLNGKLLSGRRTAPASPRDDAEKPPLIVALHGGSYSSAFFDVAGYSLLDRAAAAGCPAIALDRPGYMESTLIVDRPDMLVANAERLDAGITRLWRDDRHDACGVVLVGHSIGGAIAILLAGRQLDWPLLGIAVSGVGLVLPPDGPIYESDEVTPERIDVPADLKNAAMFGRPESYSPDAPAAAANANAPVVYREIIDINTRWEPRAKEHCARVRVPVHYRQGEYDVVWSREQRNFDAFVNAFSGAAYVDAEIVENAAHAIDFHLIGPAFQNEQIAFARKCCK